MQSDRKPCRPTSVLLCLVLWFSTNVYQCSPNLCQCLPIFTSDYQCLPMFWTNAVGQETVLNKFCLALILSNLLDILLNFKMYLFKLQSVFVLIEKCICPNCWICLLANFCPVLGLPRSPILFQSFGHFCSGGILFLRFHEKIEWKVQSKHL